MSAGAASKSFPAQLPPSVSGKFLFGGKLYICMGGTHSEREYFAKSARREVTDPFSSYENALLSFGSIINLTSREKV